MSGVFSAVLGPGTPAGAMQPYGGAVAPDGWLLCYGQAVSRSTYATLFAAISTLFGVGDGVTTFNLPDMRGRVPVGQDNMGGAAANRIAAANALAVAAGAATHVLTTAELAAHGHNHTHGAHSHGLSVRDGSWPGGYAASSPIAGGGASAATDAAAPAADATAAGGGGGHNNVQPYQTFTYIIKT